MKDLGVIRVSVKEYPRSDIKRDDSKHTNKKVYINLPSNKFDEDGEEFRFVALKPEEKLPTGRNHYPLLVKMFHIFRENRFKIGAGYFTDEEGETLDKIRKEIKNEQGI